MVVNLICRDPSWIPRLYDPSTLDMIKNWRRGFTPLGYDPIAPDDWQNFVAALHGLSPYQGLDLLLHSYGGCGRATKTIMEVLRKKFWRNLRVLVPEKALSAGTMLAWSASTILMNCGAHLGHIRGAENIQVTHRHLETGMFWQETVGRIMVILGNPAYSHELTFSFDECVTMGLKVKPGEADPALYEIVTSLHSAILHTLPYTPASKLIENHRSVSIVRMRNSIYPKTNFGHSR